LAEGGFLRITGAAAACAIFLTPAGLLKGEVCHLAQQRLVGGACLQEINCRNQLKKFPILVS
jgi:hypothetical protein